MEPSGNGKEPSGNGKEPSGNGMEKCIPVIIIIITIIIIIIKIIIVIIIIIIIIKKNSNRRSSRGHRGSKRRARTGATRTHVDRTHSLTHLHQHSYNHVLRSASSAITEFGI